MKKIPIISCLLTLMLASSVSFAQTSKEQALAKAKEAIRMEDEEGKYDEAIKLLEEARTLDPDNIVYPYELAYTWQAKKEYKKAADLLEPLLKHPDVYDRVYQALGNAYDYLGKSNKAIETYEEGLTKFPKAGRLYLELGNVYNTKKDYSKALVSYEKGIEVEPAYASNYYWAAKIFCGMTQEEVWGMIYGELFINLERNTKRTAEISKLLLDTYKSEIKFTSDTSYTVSFCKTMTLSLEDIKDPAKFKLPFGGGCYEFLLMTSIAGERSIDINSLDNIRTSFIESYFKGDFVKKYPNVLFDYQKRIKEAGHQEAYNHWILMYGDEDNFEKWKTANTSKWDSFIAWFKENKLQLDESHRFHRSQY